MPHSGSARGIAQRCRRPEIMDQPGLDATAHAAALRGLGRINRLSRSASILWPSIAGLAQKLPIRVLDLASGGGDVPIGLARRARRAGLEVRIAGCDVSPVAVAFATRAASEAGVEVPFFRLDALNEPIPDDYNIVMCSLFLHHLEEDAAVGLLRAMAGAARSMVLVNDLLRSTAGLRLAQAGCLLLSGSPIVRHDGPASVRAAFNLAEVRELAARAGLEGARLVRRWPCRFLLLWSRRCP